MPARRANWYNLNSTRKWPLAGDASGVTDDGDRLPGDLFLDLRLRFPSTLGRYAFLSGISVSQSLVRLVFLATEDPQGADDFVPLAALTLPRSEAAEFAHNSITPLAPGVGGFVVLGDLAEDFQGKFSTPAQSLLAPRAAIAYTPPPIPAVRKKDNRNWLSGLVTLRGGADLEIVKETREIVGVGEREALVFRLVQEAGGPNVLAKYLGDCDPRPESRNCLREGIEAINEAIPDCDGNLNICYQSLQEYPFSSCGGAVLTNPTGIDDICEAQNPDRFSGRDLCEPSASSSSSSSATDLTSDVSSSSSSESRSSGSLTCGELPFCDSFDAQTADFFAVILGAWTFQESDSPEELCPPSSSADGQPYIEDEDWSYTCTAGFQRNVAVWDGCAYASSLDKRVTTDLQITGTTVKENGGIVINYRLADPVFNPHIEYFHAILDRQAHELQLWWFRETAPLVKINSVSLGDAVVLGHWYRLQVETELISGSLVDLRVTASGVSNPAWATASLSTPTTSFLPDNGLFGLGSIRSETRFAFFSVEEF